MDQQLVAEAAVGAEGEGPQKEEPEGVHAELLREEVRIHHVALALGHLAPIQQQPAVTKDLFGQGEAHAHKHGGPDDGMEADDLLADDMDIGRPEGIQIVIFVIHITQSGHIVEKGVDPNIDHVAWVKVHGDPPGEGGPGDAQILQTGLNEVVHHFVHPGTGLQKAGVFQQVLNLVRILGEAEEVSLLLRVLDLSAAVGALAVHQLALRPEGLAGLAVLAHIFALVDIPLVVHGFEDLLNGGDVVIVGGTDKTVIADVHQLPQVQNAPFSLHDVVYILLGGDPGGLGLILNLLPVLIGAGKEHDVVALEPLIPGDDVGGYGAVGVADVELVRGVIDGGSDIKFFRHFRQPPFQLLPELSLPADDLE